MSGLATYQFDPSIFEAVGDDRVSLNGPTVFAANIQIDSFPRRADNSDDIDPVYFEVWDIAITRHGSTCRPRNQSELLEALDTIGADFEEWLDAQLAA